MSVACYVVAAGVVSTRNCNRTFFFVNQNVRTIVSHKKTSRHEYCPIIFSRGHVSDEQLQPNIFVNAINCVLKIVPVYICDLDEDLSPINSIEAKQYKLSLENCAERNCSAIYFFALAVKYTARYSAIDTD